MRITSKTLIGVVIGLYGWLSRPDVLATMTPKWANITLGVGAAVSIIGLRHAISKQSSPES